MGIAVVRAVLDQVRGVRRSRSDDGHQTKHREVRTIEFWNFVEAGVCKHEQTPKNIIPMDSPDFNPLNEVSCTTCTDWSTAVR